MDKKSRSKVIALSPMVVAMLAVAGHASAAPQHDAGMQQQDAQQANVVHAGSTAVELDLTGIIATLDGPIDEALLAAEDVKCTFYSTGGGGTKCTFYSTGTETLPNIAADGGFYNV